MRFSRCEDCLGLCWFWQSSCLGGDIGPYASLQSLAVAGSAGPDLGSRRPLPACQSRRPLQNMCRPVQSGQQRVAGRQGPSLRVGLERARLLCCPRAPGCRHSCPRASRIRALSRPTRSPNQAQQTLEYYLQLCVAPENASRQWGYGLGALRCSEVGLFGYPSPLSSAFRRELFCFFVCTFARNTAHLCRHP